MEEVGNAHFAYWQFRFVDSSAPIGCRGNRQFQSDCRERQFLAIDLTVRVGYYVTTRFCDFRNTWRHLVHILTLLSNDSFASTSLINYIYLCVGVNSTSFNCRHRQLLFSVGIVFFCLGLKSDSSNFNYTSSHTPMGVRLPMGQINLYSPY